MLRAATLKTSMPGAARPDTSRPGTATSGASRSGAAAVVSLFLALCAAFCARADAAPPLKISVSIYPLARLVEQAGGALVEVYTIIPPGAEPHEYEPTPKDIIGALRAKVFFYQGGMMEPWVIKLLPNLKKKGITAVEMTTLIRNRDASALISAGGIVNPHTWLDPALYAVQAGAVADALIEADPSNRAAYEKNTGEYIKKLNLLDDAYRQGLKSCAARDLVVPHDFFAYPARRYGLKTHPLRGPSTDEEVSPKKLAGLANLINKTGIKFVFREALERDKYIETLAQETGAQILELNPFESPAGVARPLRQGDKASEKDYLSVMNENLATLKKALGCK